MSLLAPITRLARALLGQRPPRLQVAALVLRRGELGPEVLLISSRDTGRWVLPKGWPMKGKSLATAAQREAWEEAGVTGPVCREPLGQYSYDKRDKGGLPRPVQVSVFAMTLRRLETGFPEEGKRKLIWVSPAEAARLVDEPELSALLSADAARFSVVLRQKPK